MNYLLAIFFVVVYINNSCNQRSKDAFTLIEARAESWTAGMEDGGSGVDYSFKILVIDSKIKFDSVWTDKKGLALFVSKKNSQTRIDNFDSGDTIIVRASIKQTPDKKVNNVTPPMNYEGGALLGYFVNGERKYFTVKEMKRQHFIMP